MGARTLSQWWNYKTRQYDSRASAPLTDEEARQYIEQNEAAQAIYNIHRELGLDVLHALLETLKAQAKSYSTK